MLVRLCKLCSIITTCAPECKSIYRNSDLQICVEACAKMCHSCVNMIVSERMYPDLVHSLKKVCTWCLSCCERLEVGSMREKCMMFTECCRHIIQECEQNAKHGAAATECIVHKCSHREIDLLHKACQAMVTEGIYSKPAAMLQGKMDHSQLADAEACLHFCRCMQFLCQNCPENVDCAMVHHCRRLCRSCVSCGFCAKRASQCVHACGAVCGDDPESSSRSAQEVVNQDLVRFIQSMVDQERGHR